MKQNVTGLAKKIKEVAKVLYKCKMKTSSSKIQLLRDFSVAHAGYIAVFGKS